MPPNRKTPSHFPKVKRADSSAQSKYICICSCVSHSKLEMGYFRVNSKGKIDIDAAVGNGDLAILVTKN